MGDIDLDAAEVVHHLHQSLHIHRHVVIDGQLVLVVDDLRQSGNAAAVGEGHGVDLVVGGGVGLAVGEGDFAALGTHEAVAGDLQHPQRAALDVELAVEDHVRHAVVGGGVVGVVAAFLIVDAADEDVDHIALVLLEGLYLSVMEGASSSGRRFSSTLPTMPTAYTTTPEMTASTASVTASGSQSGVFFFFLRRRGGSLPPAGVERRGRLCAAAAACAAGEALRGRAFLCKEVRLGRLHGPGCRRPFGPPLRRAVE